MRLGISFVFGALICFSAHAELYAIDGDSLEGDGRRIRLQGIDAPEYKQLCRNENGEKYYCGQEALKYLQNLMQGKKISCECEEECDRYKRELCVCYADDLELNKAMVRNGHAVRYHAPQYKNAERKARKQKRGIWKGNFMRPALYRSLQRAQGKQYY